MQACAQHNTRLTRPQRRRKRLQQQAVREALIHTFELKSMLPFLVNENATDGIGVADISATEHAATTATYPQRLPLRAEAEEFNPSFVRGLINISSTLVSSLVLCTSSAVPCRPRSPKPISESGFLPTVPATPPLEQIQVKSKAACAEDLVVEFMTSAAAMLQDSIEERTRMIDDIFAMSDHSPAADESLDSDSMCFSLSLCTDMDTEMESSYMFLEDTRTVIGMALTGLQEAADFFRTSNNVGKLLSVSMVPSTSILEALLASISLVVRFIDGGDDEDTGEEEVTGWSTFIVKWPSGHLYEIFETGPHAFDAPKVGRYDITINVPEDITFAFLDDSVDQIEIDDVSVIGDAHRIFESRDNLIKILKSSYGSGDD